MPRSTTRPPSRTMISSTCSSPASRWVIEQGRPTLGQGEQVGGERVGGRGVEVLRRLVEDEDGEVGQQGAGHGHPLALAAREAGPPRPDRGAPGRRAARPASRPGRPDRGRALSSSSSAPRRPTRRFSASVVSKRWGLCSTRPTTRRTSSAASRSSGTPSSVASPASSGQEAHEHVGQRRLAGAARPDQGHPASRAQVEVDARAARPGRRPGTPAQTAAQHERVRARPRPARAGRNAGPSTGGGASMAANTRPAAAARQRCSAWVAAGSGETSSKAASGTRASTARSAPSRWPPWVARTPRVSAPQLASPASAVVRPRPMPAVPAPWRASGAQPAVRPRDALELLARCRP